MSWGACFGKSELTCKTSASPRPPYCEEAPTTRRGREERPGHPPPLSTPGWHQPPAVGMAQPSEAETLTAWSRHKTPCRVLSQSQTHTIGQQIKALASRRWVWDALLPRDVAAGPSLPCSQRQKRASPLTFLSQQARQGLCGPGLRPQGLRFLPRKAP